MIPLDHRILLSMASLIPAPSFPLVPIAEHLIARHPLRDYQFDMLAEAAEIMQCGVRRVLLQLPTGGGKTRMATAALDSTARQSLSGQFVVHRKELIDQTSGTFTECGLPHSFVAAKRPFDPTASVHLAGVQTLVNRLDLLFPPDLVIIDEAHHATAATWQRVLAAYPGAFILGLTATPERLDGRGLDDHFDEMVCGPSVAELIEWGYLSPFDYYAPGIPDLTGVGTTAGDFNRGAAADVMDRPKLVGDVVEHYQRLAAGQQGIVFAASREHSRHMAEAFRSQGVRATHVDGAMDDERTAAVDAFRAGDLRVLCNVDLLGEGFDVPGIVYVGLARPTKSLSLHRQQCGRALRVLPGKGRAIICDHAGNAIRLSDLPDTDREWSLLGREGRQRPGGPSDADPVRQCLVCYRVSPSRVPVCPGCGTTLPRQERKLEQEEGQLTKLDRDLLKRKTAARRKAEERACKFEEDFVRLGIERGYQDPEAWGRMRIKTRRNAAARWSPSG